MSDHGLIGEPIVILMHMNRQGATHSMMPENMLIRGHSRLLECVDVIEPEDDPSRAATATTARIIDSTRAGIEQPTLALRGGRARIK